jgi:hypothetical protein
MGRDDVLMVGVMRLEYAQECFDRRRMQKGVNFVDDDNRTPHGQGNSQNRKNLGDSGTAMVEFEC